MSKDKTPSMEKKRATRGIEIDQSLINASRPKRQRQLPKQARENLNEPNIVRWSVQEREKLLEALYRHSHFAFESISQVVKTKTPKEVEQFITRMLNTACHNYHSRLVEADAEKGAAPLELWLALLHEIVMSDKRIDHSKHYTKIMSVIGRNEPMPEDSGFEGLNWRNLYQFISDLLADKAGLPSLTNMESLVMLDMMHNLGDLLHTSDTQQQRKLLDLKYQLCKWQIQSTRGSGVYTAFYSAVNNDFSKVEYSEKNSQASTSSTASGGESTLQQPTSSASAATTGSSSSISTSSSDLQSNLNQPFHSGQSSEIQVEIQIQPSSSSSSSTAKSTKAETSNDQSAENQEPSNPNTTHSSSSTAPPPRSSVLNCDKTSPQDIAYATPRGNESEMTQKASFSPAAASSSLSQSTPQAWNSTNPTTSNTSNQLNTDNIDNSNTELNASSIAQSTSSQGREEENKYSDDNDDDEYTDPLPKLFSLNPLTIPPHLLDIRPKNIENDIPFIIR